MTPTSNHVATALYNHTQIKCAQNNHSPLQALFDDLRSYQDCLKLIHDRSEQGYFTAACFKLPDPYQIILRDVGFKLTYGEPGSTNIAWKPSP